MRIRLKHLVSKFRRDEELREEIESHIQMRAELNRAQGLSEADAMKEARRQFGNALRIEEDTRAIYVNRLLETMLQDIRSSNACKSYFDAVCGQSGCGVPPRKQGNSPGSSSRTARGVKKKNGPELLAGNGQVPKTRGAFCSGGC